MPVVKLMSFNLRNMNANDGANAWPERAILVADVIKSRLPDILGTQEGFLPQIETLCTLLPEYAALAVGRDDGFHEGETCALFYLESRWRVVEQGTFWFSETPDIPGSRHWTRHHPRICTWAQLQHRETGTALTVLNVHLDHESVLARQRSVEMLLEYIPAHSPTLPSFVMGDFNMTPDDPAIGSLTVSSRANLKDSFASTAPAGLDGTYHDFTGRTDMGRIDYIFASRPCTVLSAEIVHDAFGGRYPSDHFPIFAEIAID